MRNTILAFALVFAGLTAPAVAQRRPTTPPDLGGNLPAQPIGLDDLIAVSIYDAPELSRTIRVSSDGTIRLPMLKQRIKAIGLMPVDLEREISTALEAENILVEPVVTVTVSEYHSRPISVAGAVRKPVTFQAYGTVTLLDAISRADGLGNEAGSEILVTIPATANRAAELKRIPVKNLIEGADASLNLRLTGGEEIRVPDAGRVYVVGNVKKPGVFAIREASETTILQLLAVAEGLLPYATKQAYIYRKDPKTLEKKEIVVDLRQIIDRKQPDIAVQPGDILYIPDNRGRRASMQALERIVGFGASTASGLLIWGAR